MKVGFLSLSIGSRLFWSQFVSIIQDIHKNNNRFLMRIHWENRKKISLSLAYI
jgi:hypothetical protein